MEWNFGSSITRDFKSSVFNVYTFNLSTPWSLTHVDLGTGAEWPRPAFANILGRSFLHLPRGVSIGSWSVANGSEATGPHGRIIGSDGTSLVNSHRILRFPGKWRFFLKKLMSGLKRQSLAALPDVSGRLIHRAHVVKPIRLKIFTLFSWRKNPLLFLFPNEYLGPKEPVRICLHFTQKKEESVLSKCSCYDSFSFLQES